MLIFKIVCLAFFVYGVYAGFRSGFTAKGSEAAVWAMLAVLALVLAIGDVIWIFF